MSRTMKAVMIYEKGGPEVLNVERCPIPEAKPGWALIKIKAFGLNRSEMFTRQGHSPGVDFPRILGIEAVGIIEDCPDNTFRKGDVVATCMGGLGRDFDGGYAEYACQLTSRIKVVPSGADLGWEIFGAMPEMLQTVWGSLFKSLRLRKGDTLLIRGGTSSIGLCAAAIAKSHGATVAATSRSTKSEKLLLESGASHVFIDDGAIASKVRQVYPEGVDKVLELIGVATLEDSMKCTKEGGIVCNTGIAGGTWSIPNFAPMDVIPTGVCLTVYADATPAPFLATPLEEYAQQIKAGTLKLPIGKVLGIDDIVEAHRLMDSNSAGGKIVVLT